MLPYPLTIFENQRFNKNEPKFNGAYSIKIYLKSIGNKNIIRNIYRVQALDSITCGYFCIGFFYFYVKM